jgi:hypothetical protein
MEDGNESQPEAVLGAASVIAGYLLEGDRAEANRAIEKALEAFGPDELADAIRQQMNTQGRGKK